MLYACDFLSIGCDFMRWGIDGNRNRVSPPILFYLVLLSTVLGSIGLVHSIDLRSILLHPLLFLVSLNKRSKDDPDYDSMLLIHFILNLTWSLCREIVSRINFHSFAACPKYESFPRLINPSRRFSSLEISCSYSFAFLLVHIRGLRQGSGEDI